jgi:hypothetical protein
VLRMQSTARRPRLDGVLPSPLGILISYPRPRQHFQYSYSYKYRYNYYSFSHSLHPPCESRAAPVSLDFARSYGHTHARPCAQHAHTSSPFHAQYRFPHPTPHTPHLIEQNTMHRHLVFLRVMLMPHAVPHATCHMPPASASTSASAMNARV